MVNMYKCKDCKYIKTTVDPPYYGKGYYCKEKGDEVLLWDESCNLFIRKWWKFWHRESRFARMNKVIRGK